MTDRQSRLLRASAASGVATTLAAVSHTVGGGLPPHPLLILAVSVLLVPLSAVLIGRRPSRVRTAATVTAAQLAFHLIFQFLGGTLASNGTGQVGHVHEIVLGPVSSLAAPDALMLLSHLSAAIVTTLLFWHGERMLREIAAWVEAVLPALPTAPAPRHPAVPGPFVAVATAPRLTRLAHSVSRRGPPLP